jgi:DNA-binding SARP family transcriptional activator/Tfp pilus assembly protein PilF
VGNASAVRLLGLIEVSGPLGTARLVGARQRALVAMLALNVGTVVGRDRLIDGLWGEDPPRTALRTLQSHVARVRQALDGCGLTGVLRTREPGYLLAIPPEQVDAHEFEQAVRRGRAAGTDAGTVRELGAALALWRGEALVDAGDLPWARAQAERLSEQRLATATDYWAARLRLGDHADAVAPLETLIAGNPTREELAGLLMLALYRCDRQADALDRYQRVRAQLSEALGIDPGTTLTELHTAMLRRDPGLDLAPAETPAARAQRPAQLPPETGHFTGRDAELSMMDTALGAGGQVLVVSGAAGVGKSALAVRWAHRMADRFPDGQLYLDLRGHDPERALSPGQVLTHVLRALGIPAERIPLDVTEQTDLFRSLVRDRRLLILLDDAGTADHVLPLVPPTATSALAVTSRRHLSGIAVRYAVRAVTLDVMAEAEAVELLGRILGRSRMDTEPGAVGELVELCGRMPLALRIAAAKLAYRPRQLVADLVAELAGDDRLDALAVDGDTLGLRAVFDSAYQTLSEPAAEVFRLLGLHPGATFGTHLAAAVAEMSHGRARRAVDELAAAHLITEIDSGRYRFHDLIRLYAAECARLDESPESRAAAGTRLLDWYLAVLDAANRTLDPTRDLLVPDLAEPAEPPFALDAGPVLAFLDRELGNLVPVVALAADSDTPLAACQLTYLLASFFDRRAHWWDRVTVCEQGVAAARRLGDPSIQGLMYRVHGVACIAMRRYDDALGLLTQALALTRAGGDKRDEGHVLNNMAVAYTSLRRFDEAVEHFDLALALHTEHDPAAVAVALNNIGYVYALTGDAERAVDHLSRALVLARQVGDEGLEAAILHGLGQAHRAGADHEKALDFLRQSLDAHQRIGDQRTMPGKMCDIGEILAMLGRYSEAVDQFDQARRLSQQIDDLHVEAQVRGGLGHTYLLAGDLSAARRNLDIALAMRLHIPDHYEEARLHRWLGELATRQAQPTVAAGHFDQAILLYTKANAHTEAAECEAARPLAPATS